MLIALTADPCNIRNMSLLHHAEAETWAGLVNFRWHHKPRQHQCSSSLQYSSCTIGSAGKIQGSGYPEFDMKKRNRKELRPR